MYIFIRKTPFSFQASSTQGDVSLSSGHGLLPEGPAYGACRPLLIRNAFWFGSRFKKFWSMSMPSRDPPGFRIRFLYFIPT